MTIHRIGSPVPSSSAFQPDPQTHLQATIDPAPSGSGQALDAGTNRKRSALELPLRKRLKTSVEPNVAVGSTLDLEPARQQLKQLVTASFLPYFEQLSAGNQSDIDNWLLADHQLFFAAFLQSVQDAVDQICAQQRVETMAAEDIDTVFQDALRVVADLAAKSESDSMLNQFLHDPDHESYRTLVTEPDRFSVHAVETEQIFERVATALNELVPNYSISGRDMWRLCIDPQVVALLKQRQIRIDAPLIGRFLFDGEKNFLYNMARGWEFLVQAMTEGKPLNAQFHTDLNAICTGRLRSEKDGCFSFAPARTHFLMLEEHTVSSEGKVLLEQTLATLQARGLNIELKSERINGLNCYELTTDHRQENRTGILWAWMEECFARHQEQEQAPQTTLFPLHHFELAIKLNQAHVHSDGNIRANHLMLNGLRLARKLPPFMFAEPNAMDGHLPAELAQKMESALAGNSALPKTVARTALQNDWLQRAGKSHNGAQRRLRRNLPPSYDYLELKQHREQAGRQGRRQAPLDDFLAIIQEQGWTLQRLRADPATFFTARHAYLNDHEDELSGVSLAEKSMLMNDCAEKFFPHLDVAPLVELLVQAGHFGSEAKHHLFKPLWDLQGYLHSGGKESHTLQSLLATADNDNIDQARKTFLHTYERFLSHMRTAQMGAINFQMALKLPLVTTFFSTDDTARENLLLARFRSHLANSLQESSIKVVMSTINTIKSKADAKNATVKRHDELRFCELDGDLMRFTSLYGSYFRQENSHACSALSHMGLFLFPEASFAKIFKDMLQKELAGKKNTGLYLSALWEFQWFLLREKKLDGFEGLQILPFDDGHLHIQNFVDRRQDKFARLDTSMLKTALISRLFPHAEISVDQVGQDIESLKAFLIQRSAANDPKKILSGYNKLLDELPKLLGSTGWQDNDLGEFLDTRRDLLLKRNRTLNPKTEKPAQANTMFGMLTIVAEQKYPVMHEFVTDHLAEADRARASAFLSSALNLLTLCRDRLAADEQDTSRYLQAINETVITEFLDDKKTKLPPMVTREKFTRLMQQFPAWLEQTGTTRFSKQQPH